MNRQSQIQEALRDISDAELAAELHRRAEVRERERERTGFQPCDECLHFPPPNYAHWAKSTCLKGHKMRFLMPGPKPDLGEWGHHRIGCGDREEKLK